MYMVKSKNFSRDSVFFSGLLGLLFNRSKSPEKKMPSIEKSLVKRALATRNLVILKTNISEEIRDFTEYYITVNFL